MIAWFWALSMLAHLSHVGFAENLDLVISSSNSIHYYNLNSDAIKVCSKSLRQLSDKWIDYDALQAFWAAIVRLQAWDKTRTDVKRIQSFQSNAASIDVMLKSILIAGSTTWSIFMSQLFSTTLYSEEAGDFVLKNIDKGEASCTTQTLASKLDRDFHQNWCAFETIQSYASCGAPTAIECDYMDNSPEQWLPDFCDVPAPNGALVKEYMLSYVLDFNLEDVRQGTPPMQPAFLDDSLYQKEGFVYLWLYRAIYVAVDHTVNSYPCGRTQQHRDFFIPGWKVVAFTKYQPLQLQIEESQPVRGVPFIFFLKSSAEQKDPQKCKYVVIIRGTQNAFEGSINKQIKMSHEFIYSGARLHLGYKRFALSALRDTLRIFRQLNIHKCDPAKSEFTVAGHSLGGAMTQVFSYILAAVFPDWRVTAVAFASPNVFNDEALKHYRRTVNGRVINVRQDYVTKIGCPVEKFPRGVYFCEGNQYNEANWYQYRQSSGLYLLDLETYEKRFRGGVQVRHFNKDYDDCNAPENDKSVARGYSAFPFEFKLTHICSYNCFMSQFCDSSLDASLLWDCNSCEGDDTFTREE